ncbi:hypothetical protein EJB05_15203, partial [Eragrostis curvula]
MELVTGALGSVIPKLWGLVKEEYNLQKGMKEQIESLALELESAHAALRKVAEVPPDDEQVKIWARIVREASYDMEDAIDTFLVRIRGREHASPDRLKRLMEKIGGLFGKAKARHQVADMISAIKKQVDHMAERCRRYNIDDVMSRSAAPPSTIDPRLAAMYTKVTELIGIDKSRGELMSLISSDNGDDESNRMMKMVSVVGGGGLGKTTLAKASYDMLKVDFDCGAFVPVGRNPDLKKVLRDILLDLDKKMFMNINMDILDERLLINELLEFLKNKRYLIVIDDLWDTKSWEIIKLAFTDNNFGSRVVVTTRNLDVAKEVGEIYKLQPLSYDNSKKLFYTRIFGGEGKYLDNQPDKASDKFLKKCDGVPLAIITMASLLVGKQREEWSDMYKSIGFGDKDNRHVENTMKILSFSYYDLPSHLRTCLLYLSAFPEDYVIVKDILIWRWIAEGFVHKKEGKGLFEIGEGYFNDLINRSMIQPVESESDGFTVEGCRVHDMVFDLTRSKSCEENFLTIIDNSEGTASQNTVRRLAYHNRAAKHTHWVSQTDMPHLRSVISCCCEFDTRVPFLSFKLLRVLSLEKFHATEDFNLQHIGNLLHLRYLGLKQISSRSNLRRTGAHPSNGKMSCVLPEEIRALKFLQTLELSGKAFKELPSSIGLLTQLVCLRVNIGGFETSYGGMLGTLTSLTSLEELTIKPNGTCNSTRQVLRELGCMKELRVLRVCIPHKIDKGVHRDFMESLRSLNNIQHLQVYGYEHFDVTIWEAAGFFLPRHLRHLDLDLNWLSRLPSYCISPTCLPHLSYLCLNVKYMDEVDLKALSGLPELRFLRLRTLFTVSLNIPASDGFFQKLRFCVMRYSMVQFITNEDSSVSFHMWNRHEGDVPFGSRTKNRQCRVAPTFMPKVEVLEFMVPVRALNDGNGTCDYLGLERLVSLRKVRAEPDCGGAYVSEVEEVESSLRHAAEVHPNRPTLELVRSASPLDAKMRSAVCEQETGVDNKV